MRCARASHRLTGGATTGGDCWFAWREPTGAPGRAPHPRGSRRVTSRGTAAPGPAGRVGGPADPPPGTGQASAKTAVTVTVTCWRPGETGTVEGAACAAAGAANTGRTGAGCCSDTLTTGPSDIPSARAYCAALVLASAAALARAAASR